MTARGFVRRQNALVHPAFDGAHAYAESFRGLNSAQIQRTLADSSVSSRSRDHLIARRKSERDDLSNDIGRYERKLQAVSADLWDPPLDLLGGQHRNMNVMNVLSPATGRTVVPYVLEREQRIPLPIDDVFAFFADATNLEAITPAWLRFQILSPRAIAMHSGARILYQLRWHGFPLRWLTEIQSWSPPTEFVDVQVSGPYRLWQHTHRFKPIDGGTLMRDMVRYALPFALLGRLAHAWQVKRELEALFDYRAVKIAEILDGRPAHE